MHAGGIPSKQYKCAPFQRVILNVFFLPHWRIGGMTASLIVQHCSEKQQLSVPPLWRNVFTEVTCTLLFRATSCILIQSCQRQWEIMQASLIDLNFFPPVMPSISLQTGFGPRPAAGHSVSVSLSFRQSQCHSLLSQRIATSVLALCVHSSIHTETQHAVQSLYLQCAIDKMSANEWNCKEHPFCVSLL